jgi:hypothetical protein
MSESILWRRLDAPGHDACRLDRIATGWRLEGMAVFRHERAAAQLVYRVSCDLEWRAQRGEVHGWLGADAVDLRVVRADTGAWTVNGEAVPDVGSCVDLDFGFTPATNLLQLQRLALHVGQAAQAPAAWLGVSTGRLELLPQRYERRAGATYWYEAPSVGYAALLEVAPNGFVRRYPGLWEAEP